MVPLEREPVLSRLRTAAEREVQRERSGRKRMSAWRGTTAGQAELLVYRPVAVLVDPVAVQLQAVGPRRARRRVGGGAREGLERRDRDDTNAGRHREPLHRGDADAQAGERSRAEADHHRRQISIISMIK